MPYVIGDSYGGLQSAEMGLQSQNDQRVQSARNLELAMAQMGQSARQHDAALALQRQKIADESVDSDWAHNFYQDNADDRSLQAWKQLGLMEDSGNADRALRQSELTSRLSVKKDSEALNRQNRVFDLALKYNIKIPDSEISLFNDEMTKSLAQAHNQDVDERQGMVDQQHQTVADTLNRLDQIPQESAAIAKDTHWHPWDGPVFGMSLSQQQQQKADALAAEKRRLADIVKPLNAKLPNLVVRGQSGTWVPLLRGAPRQVQSSDIQGSLLNDFKGSPYYKPQ